MQREWEASIRREEDAQREWEASIAKKIKPRCSVSVDGVLTLQRRKPKRVLESAAMAAPTLVKVARSRTINIKAEVDGTPQSKQCLPCGCLGECQCVGGVVY